MGLLMCILAATCVLWLSFGSCIHYHIRLPVSPRANYWLVFLALQLPVQCISSSCVERYKCLGVEHKVCSCVER